MSSSTRSPSPPLTDATPTLSASAARRIALAAQGLADPRPSGRIDRRHVRKVFERVGLIQIDSVNVLVRSQELPLFARLGPHPRHLLAAMAADGELFEYWGHEASFIPVERYPLFRFKMDEARQGRTYGGLTRLAREKPEYLATVLEDLAIRGPMTASELDQTERRKGPWWDWSQAKIALEYLFWVGDVSARRRSNFEREYDLADNVIPPHAYEQPAPTEQESRRELLALAARSLGVGTFADLADYYRLNKPRSRAALASLVDDGRLLPVRVEGWKEPAYLDPTARRPRTVRARALLSPFDSLVWERKRVERLFGMRYRIEIYTPPEKRIFGYYVLPFLLGEDLVARVDLKADRKAGVLLAPGAFAEPGVPADAVVDELAAELALMAGWLGLGRVAVGDRGDLAAPLRAAVARQEIEVASVAAAGGAS
jgi:uncharacterized protein YcaQ